jgi:predicted helicase
MEVDWEKLKYKFLTHIDKYKIINYYDFHNSLKSLTSKEKGFYFEYFCKLYFELESIRKNKYKKIYLYTEIPTKLKRQIKLPSKDKGIDCIVIDNDDNIFAIQVKYRYDFNKIIPFGELATFLALSFGTDVKVDGGIFFSSCSDVCDELKNDKYSHILFNSFNEKCNELFWKNVREYIGDTPISEYKLLKPLKHQLPIIDSCKGYYKKENNGRLYLACGTGKTFLGYWISIRELKYNKIFIVVPSLYLLSQTYETWMKETQYDKEKYHFILLGSDMDKKDDMLSEYKPTTNIDTIKKELEENKKVVVITTYHSSDLLVSVCNTLKYKFDFGIYDEAHRTVGEDEKYFTNIIKSGIEKKRIFMTATEKIYSYSNKTEKENILSMDNEKIYGKVINKYSMRQAIEDKVLVDYRLVAPFINSNKYDEKILNNNFVNEKDISFDIRTILTGLMIISAIEQYKFKHLLIFSNTNERAKKIIEFIELYLNKSSHILKDKINCKYISGNDNMSKRKVEVIEFEKSEIGIISSARIFGEGVDIKICDAICFADNKSSSVDIVQYVGRCLRKYELIPYKLSYVLVPFILNDNNDEFFNYENNSYLKLRKILKTLGTTDEMITEKIMLMDCNRNSYRYIDTNTKENIYEKKVKNDDNDNHIELDINEFTKNILSKVFDRSGELIDITRNMLIFENKKRYENNDELIDTKEKICDFLKGKKVEEPQNIKNWIKYSLGEKLFVVMKEKYYYSKDKIISVCNKLNICDFSDYKKKNNSDAKLAPYNYINEGFYYDLDPKFNLNILLKKTHYCEF